MRHGEGYGGCRRLAPAPSSWVGPGGRGGGQACWPQRGRPWPSAGTPAGAQARPARPPVTGGAALSSGLHTQINLLIFTRVLRVLVAKLRARQMRYTDYKFRWVRAASGPRGQEEAGGLGARGTPGPQRAGLGPAAQAPSHRLAKSTLTLIPLLGVHEVVFAFVTDEHAQGTLRSAKLFFDLFLSSFQVPALPPVTTRPPPGLGEALTASSLQGLLVAVLYCFLNKEVGGEVWDQACGWGRRGA